MDQQSRTKIGSFYVSQLIGQGGMSKVYLAVNPRTRERRAVKILPKRATASAASYARFLREIEIIRKLAHPNIVKILDSGVLDDCYFYMMELMSGSLAQKLQHGRLSAEEAVELFAVICGAVSHAHEHSIVHRDLKPSNILLADNGHPMVSDFGIAKEVDGTQVSLTGSNEILGTVAYLAPEQRINCRSVDCRADVYALGAIFYEMVMGFPPLGNFPWPRETRAGFPDQLQTVLARCLAIKPEDRYRHAGALLADLDLIRGAKIPEEGPPSDAGVSLRKSRNEAETARMDRVEHWFQILRLGTTKERLAVVREMVEKMEPHEARGILKMFPGEEDRVRWGLIKVLGDLKIAAAAPLVAQELKNPFHRECAIEALGKVGAEESFVPLRDFVTKNPESALIALLPLARTGREKALKFVRPYLFHEMATLRQAASRALAEVETKESLKMLRECLSKERDDRVRNTLHQSVAAIEAALEARAANLKGKTGISSEDKTIQIR